MSVFKRWNGTQWETIGPGISSARFNNINNMIAPEFDPKNTYNIGDYVVQSDKLYRCINRIGTPQAWNSGNWREVKLGQDVTELRNDVVVVSDTQPTSENNRIWVKPDNNDMKIPLVEDVMMLPNLNDYGENGQYPRSTGSGIEWTDYGLPSDEQTAEAIASWLNAHPEATTTVEDDSLTEAKFTNELKLQTIKDYVTPEMFGATGNGTTDDTQALNDCITNAIINRKMIILNKTYAFATPIVINGNVSITGNGRLKYIGTQVEGYALTFTGENTEKFTFNNVKIKLTRTRNIYGIGGICIENCMHNTFDIQVYGFSTGICLLGNNRDCDYNIIYPTWVEDNKINILIDTTGTGGCVNQNTFIGGSLRTSRSVIEELQEEDFFYSLIMRTNSNHINNNNTFYNCSFEANSESKINTYGHYNMFINCRFEGITACHIFGYGNIVIGGFGIESILTGDATFLVREKARINTSDTTGLEVHMISSQSNTLPFKISNSNYNNIFYVNSSGTIKSNGNLILKGRVTLNAGAHDYDVGIVSATNSTPAYNAYWLGSIYINDASNADGKRLLVRDGYQTWKNILYAWSATTANRPTNISVGYMMFDTTLGKPIWYKGNSIWVDATGTEV